MSAAARISRENSGESGGMAVIQSRCSAMHSMRVAFAVKTGLSKESGK
jgi:hypothetical protein